MCHGNQSDRCMCACKHVHLLGLCSACFTGEAVDVCVAVVCVRACVRDVMRVCLNGYISHAGVCACVHVSMNTYLACVLPVKAATNSKQV